MKTVSGRVVSTKPVSLSKASRILSKFVSSDNGASPAVAAYLKRASASFGELVQLHKELKGSISEHKDKKKKRKHLPDSIVIEETVNSVKKTSEVAMLTEETLSASNKKHKSGNRDHVEACETEIDGSVGILSEKNYGDENGEATDIVEKGVSDGKKHKKSKKGKGEKGNSCIGGFEQIEPRESDSKIHKIKIEGRDGKKPKKRNREDEQRESEGKVEVEEVDKREGRKRKHKGGAHEGLDDSEEQVKPKKKSRKHEIED